MNEDDWADNWKQYYKPIRIGKTLVIVPEWEEFDAAEDDLIIKMDPGMAFGTGTHETTQLCAELMEEYMPKGCTVLDVGTGSGILAFAASKLGAISVDAYDIDPVAVRVAAENALLNDCNNINFAQSDLLSSVEGTYEFASANITADIVIRMSKDIRKYLCMDALLVVSGVIDEQRDAVVEAMDRNNMAFLHETHKNGWSGLLFKAK
jgi:ribosomal protein L11 methyltransferase